MLSIYPAIIHNDTDGIWAEFPDLEGCQTFGDTLEDVILQAQEALGLYLVALVEDGKDLPPASAPDHIHPVDGNVAYVSVDMNDYRRNTKAVKKMLSIPEYLADAAEAENLSLSKVLQDALREKLHFA